MKSKENKAKCYGMQWCRGVKFPCINEERERESRLGYYW
jgi:hypothetical protein